MSSIISLVKKLKKYLLLLQRSMVCGLEKINHKNKNMEKSEIIKELQEIQAGNWTDKSKDALAAALDIYKSTQESL